MLLNFMSKDVAEGSALARSRKEITVRGISVLHASVVRMDTQAAWHEAA